MFSRLRRDFARGWKTKEIDMRQTVLLSFILILMLACLPTIIAAKSGDRDRGLEGRNVLDDLESLYGKKCFRGWPGMATGGLYSESADTAAPPVAASRLARTNRRTSPDSRAMQRFHGNLTQL
jgi:hypothetical protein